jgi:glyoxylase-like metal-dependent hydrolase (beta-lactamase superfamily II)
MVVQLSGSVRVGSLEVLALSDGAAERTQGAFFTDTVPQAEWVAALKLRDANELCVFSATSFLVSGRSMTVLVDPGYGAAGRTMDLVGGGELPQRLAEAGVSPEQVDRVVITHLHPEHFGWLLDEDRGGAPFFPRARAFVHAAEPLHWQDEASSGSSRFAGRIRTMLGAVTAAGILDTFDAELAVSEEVTMLPMPGHTPGHSVVMVESDGECLLITGDLAYNTAHLEHARWVDHYMWDPDLAASSRERFIELALERNALIAIGHSAVPTVGCLAGTREAPVWMPA